MVNPMQLIFILNIMPVSFDPSTSSGQALAQDERGEGKHGK